MNSQVGQSNIDNVPNDPNEVDLAISGNPSTNIVAPEETMSVLPLFSLTTENPSEGNLSLSITSATNVVDPEYTCNSVHLPFKRSSFDNASGEFVVGGTSNSAQQPAEAKRRETESSVSLFNANNTNPSLSLSSSLSSSSASLSSSLFSSSLPQASGVVVEEHSFFPQTTPTEANQSRNHDRRHNAGAPRASRSVNMIRASSYPYRPSVYQSQAQQHNLQTLNVRNRSAFTIGSPNMPGRNMISYSNSNVGTNASAIPSQGQGDIIIRQIPSQFNQSLFNDLTGASTSAQLRRAPAYEVQFLHDFRRTRFSQMVDIDNIAEELMDNIGSEILLQWFTGEHAFEGESTPLEQNAEELPQGLTEETIMQHLESFTFLSLDDDIPDNEKDKCPICLEDFENGNRVGRLHSCEHKYHVNCIKEWLVQRNFCPVCKRVALETNKNENDNGNA